MSSEKVLLQIWYRLCKFVPWNNEKRRENVKNRDGGTEVWRKTEGVLASDCAERQTAAVRRRFTHRLSVFTDRDSGNQSRM